MEARLCFLSSTAFDLKSFGRWSVNTACAPPMRSSRKYAMRSLSASVWSDVVGSGWSAREVQGVRYLEGYRQYQPRWYGGSRYGGDRGACVGGDAAGDDRHVNVLGFELGHEIAYVDCDIDHHQVGAAAGAQHGERLGAVLRMGHARALVHGDLGGRRELAL